MKRPSPALYFIAFALLTFVCMSPAPALSENKDIADHPACPICGMDRLKYAHSRMLITYEDGTQFGACSLHCAALEMAYRLDKIPSKLEVADMNTHQLVEAEKATWVIGGNKMGVMSANAKWAFADPAAAATFVEKEGGKIGDFETAISAAYSDMDKDSRMIRERRKMKRQQQQQHGQRAH
ncbi:MAG: nitrous oxide reductase accessory protein NosL [Desulfofustis sp.]|jgi:nitrous oxide reductase accessory protein NosL|nr:nitrous oxide reductase accessory protein NosL [Desulfofustis sp.]